MKDQIIGKQILGQTEEVQTVVKYEPQSLGLLSQPLLHFYQTYCTSYQVPGRYFLWIVEQR